MKDAETMPCEWKGNVGLVRGCHKPPRCWAFLSHHEALPQGRLRESLQGKRPWKLQSRQWGHGELRNEKRQNRREAENNASEVRSSRECFVQNHASRVESEFGWVWVGTGRLV